MNDHPSYNSAAPPSWETLRYTVRRPGCAAWETDLETFEDAKKSCDRANRVCCIGHEVIAEQRYIGDLAELRGGKRSVRVWP